MNEFSYLIFISVYYNNESLLNDYLCIINSKLMIPDNIKDTN